MTQPYSVHISTANSSHAIASAAKRLRSNGLIAINSSIVGDPETGKKPASSPRSRGGATLNQNQIATLLGLDRTVVHRAIKTMAQEGLVSERKAKSGRAIHVQLTRKGNQYRDSLIKARVAADENVRHQLTCEEHATLIRLLKLIADLQF